VTRIALIMLVVLAPSPIARGQVAGPALCKYEENCGCAAPGITVRWKAAYCMAANETDDFEQKGVQGCLARKDTEAVRKMRPCQQNAHWKAMICGVVRAKRDVQACIRDRSFIPSIVEHGAGSR
jgi:hypothetical protein